MTDKDKDMWKRRGKEKDKELKETTARERKDMRERERVRYTICPGISDSFYIVSYYIRWVTTSWPHSTLFF